MSSRFCAVTPFTIFWNQELGDIDLVVPKAYRTDVANQPPGGSAYDERWQLAVLGIDWCITHGAGPLGVRLLSKVPGTPDRIVWERVSAATSVTSGCASFEHPWILTPAGVSTPASDPARLSVVRVGSVVNASLTITVGFVPAEGHFDQFATPSFSQP